MAGLVEKFEKKLVDQGLSGSGKALMGEWDADLMWNHPHHKAIPVLRPLFDALNISAVLFSPPAEPYGTIIDTLSKTAKHTIHLKDNETRMFLHDIPVLDSFSTQAMIKGLKKRKCVVIPGHGVVTCGTVSPEQTFVNFSSVLFSCFVKYFSDYLSDASLHRLTQTDRAIFRHVLSCLPKFSEVTDGFESGPFVSEDAVLKAVSAVGKPMVNHGFVDSVMGNISCVFNNTVYISQTGSFLDALEGVIDACPMDNSACTGITASSELPTHMNIYRGSDLRTIVHGHPKFSVVMSMFCQNRATCPQSDDCNTKCPEKREIGDVPIVVGETGSGPRAICHTVPPAVIQKKAVIVFGHGVFTAGEKDFNTPFYRLCDIEKMCQKMYFEKLNHLNAL